MESMKMENQVLAEADGTVMSVRVKAGDSVMQDDVLIEFEGVEAAPAPAQPAAPKAAPAAPKAAPAPAPKPAAGAKVVKSPLPGSIVKVVVKSGDSVKKGDVLLTMESMKMENNILAEQDGTVGNIFVQPGQNVMQDDNLLEIA
ncbi:MAG: biotin/lipoyl-binding protein [Paludibacteraceae bacterium]|nr:biotin/lipoyl-binding protein [Paludibacteraceae bacterium]